DLDGYRESGGGTARLAFDGQNFDSLVSVLGWQVARSFQTGGFTITPQVRAAWWHEYRNRAESVADRLVESPFQLGSGDNFQHVGSFGTSAESQPPSTDALEVGGSITLALSDRFTVTADYLGRVLQGAAVSHSVVLTGKLGF
ncbi:MAG: autotransporter outer membrane beta-barrel domain-containing protein, partial [Chthoniobacteraceae bacterium]